MSEERGMADKSGYFVTDKDKGKRFTTPHGTGIFRGWDIPAGSNPRPRSSVRLIIKMDCPKEEHKEMVGRFRAGRLCYWIDQVSLINS